jgi:hypothetical protein
MNKMMIRKSVPDILVLDCKDEMFNVLWQGKIEVLTALALINHLNTP